MKKGLIALLLLIAWSKGYAQNIYSLQDPVTSKYFSAERYSLFRGTPYIFEDWVNGSVTTTKGTYASLQLKYSVTDNLLLFNDDDKAYEFVDEIVEFTLLPENGNEPMLFVRGLISENHQPKQFVQVLAKGNVALYKLYEKQVTENIRINEGMVKTFANNAKYYLKIKDTYHTVKLQKDILLDLLPDHQEKVRTYVASKKLNLKTEAQVTNLLSYYNSL